MFKKLGSKLKDQKGFTLIELLAVIVILGIIAAIAIPAIGNVIEKSKDKAKVAEAISIIDAARLAQTEGGGTPAGAAGATLAANTEPTTLVWTGTATTGEPLDGYLSKIKDDTYTVIYTISTGIYEIQDHDSASVVIANLAAGATGATTKVSEDTLATKASGN